MLCWHCIFHFFNQLLNVSFSQKSFNKGSSIKSFKILKVLSITYENNGRFSGSNCRQCTSTFGMSIHFCNYYTTHINCLFESFSLGKALLTYRTIHHKNNIIRLNRFLDLFHFIKELSFLFVSTRSIDNNDFHPLFFKLVHTFFSYEDRISFDVATIERHSNFGSILLQLIKSTSSESISANKTNFPSFFLIIIGNFCAGGCFSTTLKSDKHNDIAFSPFWLIGLFSSIQQAG